MPNRLARGSPCGTCVLFNFSRTDFIRPLAETGPSPICAFVCYIINIRWIYMLTSQEREWRPNSAANSPPTPQNSAVGRFAKPSQAIDIFTFFVCRRGDFRALQQVFSLPAGRIPDRIRVGPTVREGERKTRSSARVDCRLAKAPAIGKDRALASGMQYR